MFWLIFQIWVFNRFCHLLYSCNVLHQFGALMTKLHSVFPPLFLRSMYFHVHIISILAAICLHQKHKAREPSATTDTHSAQCQPVHSNNNDKVDWTPRPPVTLFQQALSARCSLKDKWLSSKGNHFWDTTQDLNLWHWTNAGGAFLPYYKMKTIHERQAQWKDWKDNLLKEQLWCHHQEKNWPPSTPPPHPLSPPCPSRHRGRPLRQQCHSVKRERGDSLSSPVLYHHRPAHWWDVSQRSGRAAHEEGTNITTHTQNH